MSPAKSRDICSNRSRPGPKARLDEEEGGQQRECKDTQPPDELLVLPEQARNREAQDVR